MLTSVACLGSDEPLVCCKHGPGNALTPDLETAAGRNVESLDDESISPHRTSETPALGGNYSTSANSPGSKDPLSARQDARLRGIFHDPMSNGNGAHNQKADADDA